MPRRSVEPDLDAVEAALDSNTRELIERLAETLGLPASAWRAVPPLRDLAVTAAAVSLSAKRPQLSRSDALAWAYESLGVDDDPARSTRPSDQLGRKLRRWKAAAVKDVRTVNPTRAEIAGMTNRGPVR